MEINKLKDFYQLDSDIKYKYKNNKDIIVFKNVIKKNLASGRHRGFVVRGDLLLFEVNFS